MTDFTGFLQSYSPEVQQLASDTRGLIVQALPGVIEQVDAPSKLIAFGFGPRMRDMICVIMPHKNGVNLGFYRGVDLPDPSGLLQGTGKRHRHVRIHNLAELHNPAIRALLDAAMHSYQARFAEGSKK
ncbi:DUF1801 domain-containing protein [bacterium]|nr:MAG: DUF1801 domain-containing protein [bacterium]